MTLENTILTAQFDTHGAELTSLVVNGMEHIWHADPKYWKRHAPILFPIVGKVWDNTYRVEGKEYHLPQHGFARDSQFQLLDQEADSVTMMLCHSNETLEKYPYPFRLTSKHQLVGHKLVSKWIVENVAEDDMYFQIGAHPAFNLPRFNANNMIHGYLSFYRNGEQITNLDITRLSPKGHALPEHYELMMQDHLLPITPTLFEHDALVIEGHQVDRVVMLDAARKEYLLMDFDAPVVGIWSPVNAPFCCIEPWYGRTDAEGYIGSIERRDHIQRLCPKKAFTFTYSIMPIV